MNAFGLSALSPSIVLLVGLVASLLPVSPSWGQTLVTCSPPVNGEFLLLVTTPTAATETQLKAVLPPNVIIPVCDYLGNRVSRMGGFRSVTDANAWAEYITQAAGLQAFVAQAPGTAANNSNSANSNSANPIAPPVANPAPAYNPQTLGTGYAVIVDFFNNPGIAVQLRTTQQKIPGLVSYGGRSYLLSGYTTEGSVALSTLQQLSQQGFQALVVDSRQVVLLTREVRLP